MTRKILIILATFLLVTGIILAPGLFRSPSLSAAISISGLEKKMPLEDPQLLKKLDQALKESPPRTTHRYTLSWRQVHVQRRGQEEKFFYFAGKLVHEKKPLTVELHPDIAQALEKYFARLGQSYYGEPLPWSQVQKIFPKYAYATVKDLETGLSFKVQRRGGTYHADVQPLTVQDTQIMKKIYGGQWSWRRRAVLMEVGGNLIAASMNGMPHGAGAVKDNQFPGHFCLHFRESKVHKSNAVDLAHQLMIAKASGTLEEWISRSQPRELITIFYTALKQHDWPMATLTLAFCAPGEVEALRENLSVIEDIRKIAIDLEETNPQETRLPVPVAVTWRTSNTEEYTITKLMLVLLKDLSSQRWYLQADSARFPDFPPER